MFNLKDITELLPFIRDNIVECAYIIILSMVVGFAFGMLVSRFMPKPQKQLENEQIRMELESMKSEVKQLSEEKEQIKVKLESSKNLTNLPSSSFINFEELARLDHTEISIFIKTSKESNSNSRSE
jgi:uncharacterized membrane protein YgaE (UPF0421/DUF939 family)